MTAFFFSPIKCRLPIETANQLLTSKKKISHVNIRFCILNNKSFEIFNYILRIRTRQYVTKGMAHILPGFGFLMTRLQD